ncbi:MAG: WbqC family protein [Bacteroidota bacterium]
MIVAVHQPNLFPWLGFFQKIYNADTFVFLDHALTNPRNPLWQKRVKMLIGGKANWLTVALKASKEQPFMPLNEIEIQALPKWDVKLKRSIEQNYSKAPFFEEGMALAKLFFDHPSALIAERNVSFIKGVCEYLGVETSLRRSSEWMHSSTSNELLVDIVSAVKGTVYLAGDGADGYQDLTPFTSKGIALINANFKHPHYTQFNNSNFQQGLSILDVIFNLGKSAADLFVQNTLKSGANQPVLNA